MICRRIGIAWRILFTNLKLQPVVIALVVQIWNHIVTVSRGAAPRLKHDPGVIASGDKRQSACKIENILLQIRHNSVTFKHVYENIMKLHLK